MLAAAGCGGASRPAPAAEPAIDERTAERDARGVVTEIYRTLGRGSTDSLFSLLDDRLVLFGPRRLDAAASRADALGALGKVVDPRVKRRAQLRSTGLVVAVSPGGHSAWAFDVVGAQGRSIAVIAILSNTADLWSVSAAALGVQPAARQLRAESARDAIVPPGATASSGIAPGAAAVVDQFKKGLAEQDAWAAELTGRDDAIVAGPIAGQVARGPRAIRALWKARGKAATRAAAAGEITAAVTGDGQLAWLSAPVTRVADGEEPLPLRMFAVYDRAGAAWKLAALHEAAAIDEPGSGLPYKTIVPPEPPRPEPARAEPAAPSDAAGPAKPRSKRKPRPASSAE